MGWAIFTGSCGAPTPPVLGPHEFPTIEIGGNKNGSVRASLPVNLDPRGTYHANVYWASQVTDLNNVMMCANLARGALAATPVGRCILQERTNKRPDTSASQLKVGPSLLRSSG